MAEAASGDGSATKRKRVDPDGEAEVPALRLTYFNAGGRAEASRLAATLAGIEFEDDRVSGFQEFQDRVQSGTLPLDCVPVLRVGDGMAVTQSTAILRYIGRLGGLYPEDPMQSLLVDECVAMHEELMEKIGPSNRVRDEEEKKRLREEYCVYALKRINLMEAHAGDSSGFYAGNSFSIADASVCAIVDTLEAGFLDHIPTTLVNEGEHPKLMAIAKNVRTQPSVVAYKERVAAARAER